MHVFHLLLYLWAVPTSLIHAKYTLQIRVSTASSADSSNSINYIQLFGSLGNSTRINFNVDSTGKIDTNFLTLGSNNIFTDKIPLDYGYLDSVTIGNVNDSLQMTRLTIIDVVRNYTYEISYTQQQGIVPTGGALNQPFKVNGQWSQWTLVGPACTPTGCGTQTRMRTCDNPKPSVTIPGDPCVGNNTQRTYCNIDNCPVDGGWSPWSAWDACTISCGTGGTQKRLRTCTNPAPINGMPCPGPSGDMQSCNAPIPCPIDGSWGAWSAWSPCPFSCGSNGTVTRNRQCNQPSPAFGGLNCSGNAIEQQPCLVFIPCPVDGGWSNWTPWSACNTSCSAGIQVSTRLCNNPAPVGTGQTCSGDGIRTQVCNNPSCIINGAWTAWNDWDACTKTCGSGVQMTKRTCTNPSPANGGLPCSGNDTNIRVCNAQPCPIDGSWSVWSTWGTCSLTCGFALQNRYRSCNNPAPVYGGKDCSGNGTQWQPCKLIDCPVNGMWGSWSEWTPCSITCGPEGIRMRNRSCNNPAPAFGGQNCLGNVTEKRACESYSNCPIDGVVGPWSEWTSCSQSCGEGYKTRSRACDDPAPKYGGLSCNDEMFERATCVVLVNCPIDGGWGTWREWSPCSATCGNGTKTRFRMCDSPVPQYNGSYCSPCTEAWLGNNDTLLPDCNDNRNASTNDWLPDYVNTDCMAQICEDALKAMMNDLASKLLNLQNSSSSMSAADAMKQANAAVSQISEQIYSKVKEGGEAYVFTAKGIAVGLSRPNGSVVKDAVLNSSGMGEVNLKSANAGNATQVLINFASLDSKMMFPGGSANDTAAPVLSLKMTSGNKTLNNVSGVNFGLTLPNLRKQQEADTLSNVNFSSSQRMIQSLKTGSFYSLLKVSIKITEGTPIQLIFKLNVIANTSSDADTFLSIDETGKLNITQSPNKAVEIILKVETPFIRITVPSKQLTPKDTLYMVVTSPTNPNSYTTTAATTTTTTTQASIMETLNSTVAMSIGVTVITPRTFTLGQWEDADVDIDSDSDIGAVSFKSNFFGAFSSKIFIAPNAINFADVFGNFGKKLSESFAVLIMLCFFFVAYAVLFVVMWKKDRQENTLLRFEPLLDNDPRHDYTYIMTVFTSVASEAGTTANVFFNLAGTWGVSGQHVCRDGWRKNAFARGAVSNFVLTTEASLGELKALRIWHDDSGYDPSWLLEKVMIEDVQNNKMFIFMCDKWLATDRFDGRKERVLCEVKRDQHFQNMFMKMKLGGVMDRHVVTGLMRKTGESAYTRVQRLSVCVTMFYLLMVSNAMYFGQDDNLPAEANFQMDLGPISISWFQFYTGLMSIIITYPCIFICAEIFRRTKRWRQRWTEEEISSQKKEWKLPRFFLFVAWSLLFVAVAVSAFFVFLYSLSWGMEKSLNWMKTFILGLAGVVFFIDPIVLMMIFVLVKKIFKIVENDNDDLLNLDQFIGDDVSRALGHDVTEEDIETLEEIKRERQTDRRLSSTIQDGLTYLLYMLMLTAIAYASRDRATYLQNVALRNIYIDKSASFTTFQDIYKWVGETAVPAIYPATLYNGMKRTGDDKQTIAACDCLRLGPFRLRQIRAKSGSCITPSPMGALIGKHECYSSYSLDEEEEGLYDPQWDSLSNMKLNLTGWKRRYPSPPEIVLGAFQYQSATSTGGYPFEGKLGIYEGGGYVASLGLTTHQAYWVLGNLSNTFWMDRQTRAVFLEGAVYNWESNLFTSIQILFEGLPGGGVKLFNFGVRTYRLYDYVGGKGMVLMVLQAVFIIVVLLNIYQEAKKIYRERKNYFKIKWNLVELFSLLLAVLLIITTAMRIKLTIDAVTYMKNNKGFFVSFDNVATWVEVTCNMLAFCCFISILRVLKYLAFNKHIAIVQSTIALSASQLSSMAFIFLCLLIAYIASGNLLFSVTEPLFSDVIVMMRSLFGVFLNIIQLGDLFHGNITFIHLVYFYTWSTMSLCVLLSVFVSMLDDTYGKVVDDGLYDYDAELVDHIWKRFSHTWEMVGKSAKNIVRRKPKDEDETGLSTESIKLEDDLQNLEVRYRRMNPSLRKKLIALNQDKVDLSKFKTHTHRSTRQAESNEGVYINPGSFTDLAGIGVNSQTTYEETIPRFKRPTDKKKMSPMVLEAANMETFSVTNGRETLHLEGGQALTIPMPSSFMRLRKSDGEGQSFRSRSYENKSKKNANQEELDC